MKALLRESETEKPSPQPRAGAAKPAESAKKQSEPQAKIAPQEAKKAQQKKPAQEIHREQTSDSLEVMLQAIIDKDVFTFTQQIRQCERAKERISFNSISGKLTQLSQREHGRFFGRIASTPVFRDVPEVTDYCLRQGISPSFALYSSTRGIFGERCDVLRLLEVAAPELEDINPANIEKDLAYLGRSLVLASQRPEYKVLYQKLKSRGFKKFVSCLPVPLP